MARRTVKQTMADTPGMPRPQGYRRETAVRRLLDKYGDPLDVIAAAMLAATDPEERARHAARLLPYVYPQLKAVELAGPDGGGLTVKVVHAPSSPPACPPAAPAAPETETGSD